MKFVVKYVLVLLRCILMVIALPFDVYAKYFIKVRRVPAIRSKILTHSATELAKLIRDKKLKSVDVVNQYIQRCVEVNPVINAIVEPRYAQALEEAKAVDRVVGVGESTPEDLFRDKPLFGVPVTIKESIQVAGMSNGAGLVTSQRRRARMDADVVALLKEAGAIPILVSNTPEFCMCIETYNGVTGVTNNPHDTRKTPGGSSGGEAALISSAASVVGIGSDIAGSLRIPAMYTGIFSHKPTPGLVSVKGHFPESDSPLWPTYFTLGPMARYAEDLQLMMKVLRNPSSPINVNFEKKVDLNKLNYYYMESDNTGLMDDLSEGIESAFEELRKHFSTKFDKHVLQANIDLKHALGVSTHGLVEIDRIENIYYKPHNLSESTSFWKEMGLKLAGMSTHSIVSIVYPPVAKLLNKLPASTKKNIHKEKAKILRDFKKLLDKDGILFMPVFPHSAIFHNTYYTDAFNVVSCLVFNCLGFPVTTCPLGSEEVDGQRMPIGIQVVAAPGCDHLCLAVAKEIEDVFGGWVQPVMEGCS